MGHAADIVSQKAALIGQVIEDITYEALDQGRFVADLLDVRRSAQYKPGGFFVFSDIPAGTYTLRLSGERFQPRGYPVTLPLPSLVLDSPGDNELIVVVKAVKGSGNRITFSPVMVNKPLRAGAPVIAAPTFSTRLAADIDPGSATEVKLEDTTGLAAGRMVRIVRDRSFRLRFDPYALLPAPLARIVGRVARAGMAELPLAGAEVRVTAVNGANVVMNTVVDAQIATVKIGDNSIVLGVEHDIATTANQQGDYNLYFGQDDFLTAVTLTATLAGYAPLAITEPLLPGQRKRIDIELVRT